jgi:hypothetical protein
MAKIVGYYDIPTAGFGSDPYVPCGVPVSYFNSYPQPFYPDWRSEPIPGWGVRPVMAGPRMVGVGAPPSSDIEIKADDHPAIKRLKQEAISKHPGDLAKQTAYVMTKGPGFGRSVEQWLASSDSAPYRAAGGKDLTLLYVGLLALGGIGVAFYLSRR